MNSTPLRDTWLQFQREHACSVDRMLCRPDLRIAFLESAKLATGCPDEEQLLWGVVTLRKKKALPTRPDCHAAAHPDS